VSDACLVFKKGECENLFALVINIFDSVIACVSVIEGHLVGVLGMIQVQFSPFNFLLFLQ
jgi:hypothetical protein